MQEPAHIVCADRLAPVLRETLAGTEALAAALARERDALEAQDAAALDAAGDAKRVSLTRLEDLDAERRQLLTLAGFAADDIGMEALLARCPDSHGLHALWAELRESASRCRDANAVNGAIVQLRRQQILRALEVLRGGVENRAAVYGADGSTRGDPGRAVGSA